MRRPKRGATAQGSGRRCRSCGARGKAGRRSTMAARKRGHGHSCGCRACARRRARGGQEPIALGGLAVRATAIGALATGAAAIGALAVGRLAVGKLAIGRGAVKRLRIEELEVGRLRVEQLEVIERSPAAEGAGGAAS